MPIPPAGDTVTMVTWDVMGSTTMPDELRQVAHQRKPGIIVATETKLADTRQDRVSFQEHLLQCTAASRATTAATVELDLEEWQ